MVIRITKDRKTSEIYTGLYIFEKGWDSKKHRLKRSADNSFRINHLIEKKTAKIQAKLLEAELDGTKYFI